VIPFSETLAGIRKSNLSYVLATQTSLCEGDKAASSSNQAFGRSRIETRRAMSDDRRADTVVTVMVTTTPPLAIRVVTGPPIAESHVSVVVETDDDTQS